MAKKYLDYDGLLYFWQKLKNKFVAKETGKGLSTNDFTTALKNKLDGIASGAEVNVQSDWSQTTNTADDFIKNKPTKLSDFTNDSGFITSASIPSATTTTPKMDGTASVGSETKWAKGDHVHPSDTSRVPNTRKVNDKALSSDITLYADDIKMSALLSNQSVADELDTLRTNTVWTQDIGVADGVCPLNSNTKIDSTYLPSYVDDVIEAYPVSGATELSQGWLSATSGGSALTPETGKIYVLMADSTSYSANTQFRWATGTTPTYVKLADGGVTSITNGEIDTIVAS
jgi:hypothetical protein